MTRYCTLFVFSLPADAERFNRATDAFTRALTPENLLARVRAMDLGDVVVDPYVALSEHARAVIRSRMIAPRAKLVECVTMADFAKRVATAQARET